jgi:hypothetical protein
MNESAGLVRHDVALLNLLVFDIGHPLFMEGVISPEQTATIAVADMERATAPRGNVQATQLVSVKSCQTEITIA